MAKTPQKFLPSHNISARRMTTETTGFHNLPKRSRAVASAPKMPGIINGLRLKK